MYADPSDVRTVVARAAAAGAGTSASALDDSTLIQAIVSAQAEVDARLAGRYRVPFGVDEVPSLVWSLTVDVAAYLATLTFRESQDLTPDDPIRLRYQRAQDLLTRLGTGELDLPGATADAGGPAETGRATVRNPYRGSLFGLGDFGLGYDRRSYANRSW